MGTAFAEVKRKVPFAGVEGLQKYGKPVAEGMVNAVYSAAGSGLHGWICWEEILSCAWKIWMVNASLPLESLFALVEENGTL